MELGARKLKILQAVIEAYIQTGEPVGSKALCELLDVSVSSATIRNEMASLSELDCWSSLIPRRAGFPPSLATGSISTS